MQLWPTACHNPTGHNYIGHDYVGTCYAPSESSRRAGRFEYRRTYTRAIGMPSAKADVGPARLDSFEPDFEVQRGAARDRADSFGTVPHAGGDHLLYSYGDM